jgi:hypothetical protein
MYEAGGALAHLAVDAELGLDALLELEGLALHTQTPKTNTTRFQLRHSLIR